MFRSECQGARSESQKKNARHSALAPRSSLLRVHARPASTPNSHHTLVSDPAPKLGAESSCHIAAALSGWRFPAPSSGQSQFETLYDSDLPVPCPVGAGPWSQFRIRSHGASRWSEVECDRSRDRSRAEQRKMKPMACAMTDAIVTIIALAGTLARGTAGAS